MWYFSWILGTALAVSFSVLNALWHEIKMRVVKKFAAIAVALKNIFKEKIDVWPNRRLRYFKI